MKIQMSERPAKHPCFNPEAKGSYGRIHLPVAPKCNIKCNFCDRKYDCVNESRPGVTSSVLTPEQAGSYLDRVVEKEPRISVAGIAGPGDPFASADRTIETLRRVRETHPDMLLCVSSNGMNIGPYIGTLAELRVSHVTITVCSVNPAIGARIYAWVTDGNIVYRGRPGAELLLDRQREAIEELARRDITVKVNCIVIPGINDTHVAEVARTVRELGAGLLNCMALFPNANTPFGTIAQPDKKTMEAIRAEAEQYLPQMRHCTRCRADAVGLLDNDRTAEFRSCLNSCASDTVRPGRERPHIAVASQEGILVNQHLGEAERFHIFAKSGSSFAKVGERQAPDPGGGVRRWHRLARILGDCRAVLVSGIGATPREILSASGIRPVEAAGFIEEGLAIVYENRDAARLKGRRTSCSDGACSGSGGGCG